MARRIYIRHQDYQGRDAGVAYFGPFSRAEINERLHDCFAEGLSQCGELECVQMNDEVAEKIYINSRFYWMAQVAEINKWLEAG